MNQGEFEGPCAGGPANGQRLTASARRIVIPINIPGDHGFAQGIYAFHEGLHMWVWQGHWPPRRRRDKTAD